MKLKTRLIVAFFTIVLLPLMLTGIALLGFGSYQLNSIAKHFGGEDMTYENISSSIQILSRFTKSTHSELENTADAYPEKFADLQFLDKINTELISKYSYLVVRCGNDIVYSGTDKNIDKIIERLPDYESYEPDAAFDGGIYVGGDIQTLVKQVNFKYGDGTEGSAFIITSVSTIIPQMKSLVVDMLIAIIAILVFTSAMLTIWIYKGINSPLKKLKEATQNIKEGNLDFTLDADVDDEIGELCADFEEMRQRLKISAEEKLQYDRESKELISNISHDLKTPITAIKGYVEGIMDGVADTPEKMNKYIKTIYNKANDMDRLINELTFYSKIDTNRIPYNFHKINVASYFNDCAEEVGLELESENIEIQYMNYTDESTQIIADPEQLKRVVNNIIGNSIKYIGNKKGFINIRIEDVGDFIQVEIEDNGKGIPTKDLPYIFDRFYRTDASRNSSKGGSGIGLSIVKKIVEDHGGKIWATSKEDTGTVMYFVIRKYQEVPMHE